mgnify:CR=1 FL=1
MADLIQIENFINKYNDNVLSVNSLLKNSPTVNFNSNTGSQMKILILVNPIV